MYVYYVVKLTYLLDISNGLLKSEDILVQPLDLLDFNSHTSAAETVIKYFKKVTYLNEL